MRMTTNDHLAGAATVAWPRGRNRGNMFSELICAFMIALVCGCTNSTNSQPGPAQTAGTGGSGGISVPLASGGSNSARDNTGTSGSLPSNAGGSSSVPGNTGGSSSLPASGGGSRSLPGSTGGSSSVPGNAGGSSRTGGSSSVSGSTGGSSSVPGNTGGSSRTGGSSSVSGSTGGSSSLPGSAGGSTGTGGTTSATGGSTSKGGTTGAVGGTGGSSGGSATGGVGASAGGNGASAGGSGGAATTSLVMPPVRDTASKVPISSAPGYTVEGNYPYGPLTAQRLDIIYPTSAGPKGTQVLPMVIMFHGGAWVHSYTNDYGSGKDHMSTFFDRFLAHGFMVCNVEYRVNDGTVDGAPAPAAVQDALLAAKWCWDYMDYFHGDKTRYVVTGASAGGHLALMVGMTSADAGLGPTSPTDFKIAGIVDGYGPADIEAELNAVAAGWIPASLPNRAAIAKEVNPMTYVRGDVPPLIVVQGANDNTAPVADSRKLVANLTAAGADATMHEVAGAGHGFTTPATAWPDAEAAMFDWLTARGIGK